MDPVELVLEHPVVVLLWCTTFAMLAIAVLKGIVYRQDIRPLMRSQQEAYNAHSDLLNKIRAYELVEGVWMRTDRAETHLPPLSTDQSSLKLAGLGYPMTEWDGRVTQWRYDDGKESRPITAEDLTAIQRAHEASVRATYMVEAIPTGGLPGIMGVILMLGLGAWHVWGWMGVSLLWGVPIGIALLLLCIITFMDGKRTSTAK